MLALPRFGRLPVWTVVAVALLALTACGWQLRGAGSPDLAGRAVALETAAGNGALARTVRRELAGLDAEVVTAAQAEQVLVLLGERMPRRVLATDNRGRALEYELRYELSYRVAAPDGTVTLSRQVATARSSYRASGEDALGEQSRRERLSDELREQAARLMLARLAAVSPSAK